VPLWLNIVDADGSTFPVNLQIRFDFNVLARIEEKTGLKMLSGMAMWSQLSASVLSVMLWAAAIPSNPEYDSPEGLEAIRSYLNKETADQAATALWEAYLLFLPKKDADLVREAQKAEKGEAVENPPQVEQTSTSISDGSTSGQSQSTTSELAKSSSAS